MPISLGTKKYSKLKTNLRLAINRLKLVEKKKTELAQKSRKEIADFISGWFIWLIVQRFHVIVAI